MKKAKLNLITTVILAAGAVLVFQSASAQSTFVANNLYMGFQNQAGGATSDYLINLGPDTSIVGGSTVVDLSAYFSRTKFNSVLGASASLYGGVVGGVQANSADIYLTQLRSGGAGIPSVPGSAITATITRQGINNTIATLSQIAFPSGTGNGTNDTTKSWESYVEPTATTSSFYGQCGINPDSLVSTSTILYEDLWRATNAALTGSKPYNYLGYFTIDLTGANPKLTFTPKDAPATLTPAVIASVQKSAGTVTVVSSNAVPNHTYQLQYTTNLNPANWIDVGSAEAASSTRVTNADTTATDSQRFYRVKGQ